MPGPPQMQRLSCGGGRGGLRRASSSSLAPRRGREIGFPRRWLKKAEMLSVLVQLGARQDVVIDFVYINNTPCISVLCTVTGVDG